MYKSRCAVEGCNQHPMWEIVWSNGQLYDVCDDHARLNEASQYDPGPDGSLLPVQPIIDAASPERGHRARRDREPLG